jgi:hypothetical protein
MATKKKKEGMMGKAIRGLNRTNVATGQTPIRAKKKAAPKKKVRKLDPTKPTARSPKGIQKSKAQGKRELEALRKKQAARVKKGK